MELNTGYIKRIARRLGRPFVRKDLRQPMSLAPIIVESAAPPVEPEPIPPPDPTVEFKPWGEDKIFRIYGSPADTSIFGAVRDHGVFEPHVVSIMGRLVTGSSIVLDVGANIGVLSCVLASLAPRGRVYAFEASSTAAAYLEKNVKANDLKNVEIVLNAVSDTEGQEISMHIIDSFLGGAFFATQHVTEGRIEKAKSITLDNWAKHNGIDRIDFIKMDIEGAEVFALHGASRILAEMQPFVCIECNAIALKRFHNKTAHELFSILNKFYRHIYIIPDFQAAAELIKIETSSQLVDALRYGRGNEDLLCSPRLLDNATSDFEGYLATIKEKNDNQEIILNPDWETYFEQERYTATPGEIVLINISLKNCSDQTWADWPKYPVVVGYHIADKHGNVILFEGERTTLKENLPAGCSEPIVLRVTAPQEKGLYYVQVSPLQDYIAWFDKVCGEKITSVELEVI